MGITEPVTMLTDYALAGAAIFFAIAVRGALPTHRQTAEKLWTLGFLASALAALIGGTMHGFALYLGPDVEAVLWKVTLTLIATGGVLFVAAGLKSGIRRDEPAVRWLLAGVVVTLVGLAVLLTRLTLHTHFNHNDLYHSIQIVGFYLLYRGIVLIGGAEVGRS